MKQTHRQKRAQEKAQETETCLLDFVLSYYILFYNYPLEACLFSKERQKESGSQWEGKWEETGRSTGRENCNQDLLSEGKKSIFNKKKRKENCQCVEEVRKNT